MITTINEFKKELNENLDFSSMLHINLLDKYKDTWQEEEYRTKFEEYKSKIKGFKDTNGKYNIGDIIEFTAGYNDDIRYTTEILGFDENNDIYLLWDSYWAPIKDDNRRNIKLVKSFNESNLTDNIEGGLSDNKTLLDIANMHDVSIEDIENELKMGIKIEMEHTNDSDIAFEIAKDHLVEIPNYYTKLQTIENE